MAAKIDKTGKEKVDGVIIAVYKVNLHCPQCACKIKKPLLRTQGVHSADFDIENGEIKVVGVIEALKIHKLIEKWSKKKVELLSPQIKIKESTATQKKQEQILRKTTVKVHMHCHKCEYDLQKILLKHKGIYSIKTDMKTQTVTVEGIIESDKLVSHIQQKVHKHAEIITSKFAEKGEKEKLKVEAKSTESAEIKESKEEVKVEVNNKNDVSYFVHHVYAPQLFSDENPNACSVM